MATAPAGWTGPGGGGDRRHVDGMRGARARASNAQRWSLARPPPRRGRGIGRRGLLSEAPPFLQCRQSTRPPSGCPVSAHGQCESVREATEWAGLVRRFQPQATGP